MNVIISIGFHNTLIYLLPEYFINCHNIVCSNSLLNEVHVDVVRDVDVVKTGVDNCFSVTA